MIQTLRLSDFTNAFRNSDRADQFSYEGLTILFDYFEQCAPQMEFDMIGICCEWAENTPEELSEMYGVDNVLDYLENHTTVAGITRAGTIVYCSSF